MMDDKISRHALVIAFFLIPCVVPAALLDGGIIKLLFNGWRVLAFGLMFVYMIAKNCKPSKILVFSTMFSVILLFSTWKNAGNLSSVVSIAMMMFTIIALSEIEIQRDINLYFKVMVVVFGLILLVDTLQVYTGVGFDKASNATWLGGDNFAIFTVFPMIAIIVLGDIIAKGKISIMTGVFFAIVMLAKVKTFAVTSILAFVTCLILLYVFMHYKISRGLKAILSVLVIALAAMLCINFSDIYMGFAALFGKEPNIEHSRLVIWSLSLKAIQRELVLGHGVLSAYDETIAIAGTYWPTCSHTHNYLLELLFRSGIVGTICYLISFKDYFKVAFVRSDSACVDILRAFLVANMVLWVTDSYYAHAPVYILAVLSTHVNKLSMIQYQKKVSKIIFE